ncbi:hypothetical protein [Streptosporangium sp. NPDC002721]|uniref:hypothetical protein n=1 Tax=Streptosporangium sp. NPDC002721 TaxID=3366188 RepID=UPI0036AA3C2C
MFVLGVSWLILTPLCLWNLFRGGTLVRLTSVMSLVALEAATIWATTAVHIPERTPVAAPLFSVARTEPPLRSRTPLPETAQRGTRGAPAGQGELLTLDQPGGRGPSGVRNASCRGRMPAPERVRLARRQGAPRGVTLFWKARADECDTATVVLHHRNRTIKVWMREGEAESRSSGATTWPVSVAGGVASLEVPLAEPVRDAGAFRAIDGRTGRPIALIRPGRVPEEPSTVR